MSCWQRPRIGFKAEHLGVIVVHNAPDPAHEGRSVGFHPGEILDHLSRLSVLQWMIDLHAVGVAVDQDDLPGECRLTVDTSRSPEECLQAIMERLRF